MKTFAQNTSILDVIESMDSANSQLMAYRSLANSALMQAIYRFRRYLELQARYPIEGFEATLDERARQDDLDTQTLMDQYNKAQGWKEAFLTDGQAAAQLYNTICADMDQMTGLRTFDYPMTASFYFKELLPRPTQASITTEMEAEIRTRAAITGKSEEYYRLRIQLDAKTYREGYLALQDDIMDLISAAGTMNTGADHVFTPEAEEPPHGLSTTMQISLANKTIDKMLDSAMSRLDKAPFNNAKACMEARIGLLFATEGAQALADWIEWAAEAYAEDLKDALDNGYNIPDLGIDARQAEIRKRKISLQAAELQSLKEQLAA